MTSLPATWNSEIIILVPKTIYFIFTNGSKHIFIKHCIILSCFSFYCRNLTLVLLKLHCSCNKNISPSSWAAQCIINFLAWLKINMYKFRNSVAHRHEKVFNSYFLLREVSLNNLTVTWKYQLPCFHEDREVICIFSYKLTKHFSFSKIISVSSYLGIAVYWP